MANLNLTLTTTANNETVRIALLSLSVDGVIDWGDGNSTNLTGGTDYNNLAHEYVVAGVYSAIISNADDVTGITLDNSKISNFDTGDLSSADVTHFSVSYLGSGCVVDTSDMTGWTGAYWYLYSMPSGTYNIDTSDMTGWTGNTWYLYTMPSGTYNIDTSDMTGWAGAYWRLYSMPSGTYNIDTSDMTGWTGAYWLLHSMPSGTYNIDTSDMTGWTGNTWYLHSMPSGTYNISEASMQFWITCESIYLYDCIDSVTGENVFTQEVVDRVINDIYHGKLRYSGTPIINIGGTNASPSATGLAQITELEAGTYDWFPYSYNLNKGFDLWKLAGSDDIYVPYVNGVPVVSSVAGYTKQSSNPAGKGFNQAPVKVVFGSSGHDGTGYVAEAWLVNLDTDENFYTAGATNYCKELSYDDLVAITSNYAVFNLDENGQLLNLALYDPAEFVSDSFNVSLAGSLLNIYCKSDIHSVVLDDFMADMNITLVFDFDSYELKAYVDGLLKGTYTLDPSFTLTSSDDLRLGSTNADFDGKQLIKYLEIRDGALSETEVSQLTAELESLKFPSKPYGKVNKEGEANPVYHKSDWGVFANEVIISSGRIENSLYEVLTGSFKIVMDTYNGHDVKVLECVTTGTVQFPETHEGTAWGCFTDTGSGYAYEEGPASITADVLSMTAGDKVILADIAGNYALRRI